MNIAVIALAALLFAAPLLGMHIYAKAYLEPAVEQPNECKDPNSRPGSRADMSDPSNAVWEARRREALPGADDGSRRQA
jgi:hypothetical protein